MIATIRRTSGTLAEKCAGGWCAVNILARHERVSVSLSSSSRSCAWTRSKCDAMESALAEEHIHLLVLEQTVLILLGGFTSLNVLVANAFHFPFSSTIHWSSSFLIEPFLLERQPPTPAHPITARKAPSNKLPNTIACTVIGGWGGDRLLVVLLDKVEVVMVVLVRGRAFRVMVDVYADEEGVEGEVEVKTTSKDPEHLKYMCPESRHVTLIRLLLKLPVDDGGSGKGGKGGYIGRLTFQVMGRCESVSEVGGSGEDGGSGGTCVWLYHGRGALENTWLRSPFGTKDQEEEQRERYELSVVLERRERT
ncbi:hypothetical protein BD410DRAFT_804477 [Rickenella mellea]|uniref:Uncharacterized protein n=1 Tax=Rickenella mellea TaxID=50990 RepID=A0A4Y7Q063_9AGAM|nr:hypothetical protein BD410DRAFT_804477 [Rickenella mellea]